MEDVSRLSSAIARWRESALDLAFGSRACAPAGDVVGDGDAAIATDLMRAIGRFKASSMTADGARVDYASLGESEDLRAYRAALLPRLAAFDPGRLTGRPEQLAFWVNLYNALVIDAVIAFGVQRSVTEGRLGVLSFFRRAVYAIGGRCISCDDIEHGILRANRGNPFLPGPQFAAGDARLQWAISPVDPRIHFALNCASRSCPPVGVYASALIDGQLDLAARGFVDQSARLDDDGRTMRLSPIFKWYARDFGGRAGVTRFLLAHLPNDARRVWLASHGERARFTYERYDWG
jgi:hypothetical protein